MACTSMSTSSSGSAALIFVLPSVFTITKTFATHDHAGPSPPFLLCDDATENKLHGSGFSVDNSMQAYGGDHV